MNILSSFKSLRGALLLSSIMLLQGNVRAADFVVDGIAYDSCAVDGDSKALKVVRPEDDSYYAGDIVIPQKVSYKGQVYHVASFGTTDLWDKEKLTSVIINAAITEIPTELFSGCTALSQITLPSALLTIHEQAFEGCVSLGNVTLPSSLQTIENRAFEGCTSLTSFSIPCSVTSVAYDALYGCSGIATLRLEDGAETLDFSASQDDGLQIESLYLGRDLSEDYYYGLLYNPSSLKTLEIGSSVTKIPGGAFSGCTNLNQVVWGSNVITIGSGAFASCSSLESITLNDRVKEIGGSCFSGSGLKSIVIPSSVEEIDVMAFRSCEALASVTLPKDLRTIRDYCFEGCTSLTSIELQENLDSICEYAFEHSGLTDSLAIPSNVSYIGRLAFGSCKFSTMRMGAGVKTITDGAFEDCTKLRRLYYDGTIGDWCGIDFAPGCARIYDVDYEDTPLFYVREFRVNGDTAVVTDIVIPDSVKKIPMNAFANYRALKSVVIPATVDTICSGAFFSSYWNLEKATVAAKEVSPLAFRRVNELHLTADVAHLDYNAFRGVDNLYYSGTLQQFFDMGREGTGIKTYYDEENEDSVYVSAGPSFGSVGNFYIQDQLVTDISLPAMERVEASLFEGFNGLKTVSLPSNVREIGNYAFNNCSGLQEVNYHKVSSIASASQMTIGDQAFSYCRNLETVSLPASSINKLGQSAFAYCSKLSSVSCADRLVSSVKGLRAASEEQDGLEIGDYCFQCDALLYDLSFLDATNVESVGEKAFEETGWLKSLSDGPVYFGTCLYSYKGEAPANTDLKIIGGTKSISSNALYGQTGIVSVTFPSTLRRINSYAFWGTSIASLYVPATVERVATTAFSLADSLTTLKIADGETPLYITDAGTNYPCLYLDNVKSLYLGRAAEWYAKPDYFSDVVFLSARALDSLTIGPKVSHFNQGFTYSSIQDLTVMNTTPPTSVYDFYNEAESGCTLHVPASAVEAYKSTTPWSAFFNIVGESDEALAIETPLADDVNSSEAVHYNVSGVRVSPKERGLHIVKFKDGTSKKVFVM